MTNESRLQKRADLEMEVRLRSHTLADFIQNHSHDISAGGVFVRSEEPMAKHTLVKLEIAIDGQDPIRAVGRVIWTRPPGKEGSPPGMGIKFIKIDDASRARIAEIVERAGEGAGSLAPTGNEPDETPSTPPPPNAEADAGESDGDEDESDANGEEEEEEEAKAGGEPFADAKEKKKRKGKKERREEARARKQEKKQEAKVARSSSPPAAEPRKAEPKTAEAKRVDAPPAPSGGVPPWVLFLVAAAAVGVVVWYFLLR